MAKFRDYHKKSYVNPFFGVGKRGVAAKNKHRRGFGSWRNKFIFISSAVIIGVGIYFIFFSPYFSIKKIETSGLEKISYDELRGMVDEQISSRRFFIFSQNNIFIFDEKEISDKVYGKYALNFVKVNKSLPGTIKISLEEKKPALIWKTTDKFYVVDFDGAIIREITQTEVSEYQGNRFGAKMATVFDDSNTSVANKDKVLSGQAVGAITDIQNNLSRATGLVILNFVIADRNDSTLKCITGDGWGAYFSLINDLNAQINKLTTFLMDKKQEERKRLEYVDLRFEDRVYYK